MKYAIIGQTSNGAKYLLGFTNNIINESTEVFDKYTVELKELTSLFIRLEGDAVIYLS